MDFVLPDGKLLGAVGSGGVCVREDEGFAAVERYVADAPFEVIDVALSQVGKPYDWRGILGFALRRDWQETDAWFCSEFVAWCFERAGYPLLRADRSWRVTPRDLRMSLRLQPLT